jgi:hypothetical protein
LDCVTPTQRKLENSVVFEKCEAAGFVHTDESHVAVSDTLVPEKPFVSACRRCTTTFNRPFAADHNL